MKIVFIPAGGEAFVLDPDLERRLIPEHCQSGPAEAWESTDTDRWSRYLELAEAVWQGRAGEVIEQLGNELARRQIAPDAELPDDSPHQPLVTAVRYLNNHRQRMDYPRYRREGLPLTSAPMESLVKQINHRVKGTEMTCNDPEGAEAILQLRAAAPCEDGWLDDYLRRRPGFPPHPPSPRRSRYIS